MAIRELRNTIASTLLTNMTITSPTTSLSTVRIPKSTDATYGAIGWTPFASAPPWALLYVTQVQDDQATEPLRAHTNHVVQFFIAIEHADTPGTVADYDDLCNAWMDSARSAVYSNFALRPASQSLYPTSGDVRWYYQHAKREERWPVMGSHWNGVLVTTALKVVVAVNYQL